jgi:hypothetical protein
VREFNEFLDQVDAGHALVKGRSYSELLQKQIKKKGKQDPKRQRSFGFHLLNFDGWQPDRSRSRKQAWRHLEVWKAYRRLRNFRKVAKELSLNVDDTKYSYYRACELIYHRPYDPEMFGKEKWQILKSQLRRTCDTCSERDTCDSPCPDVLPYVEQDSRKKDSREKALYDDFQVPE